MHLFFAAPLALIGLIDHEFVGSTLKAAYLVIRWNCSDVSSEGLLSGWYCLARW